MAGKKRLEFLAQIKKLDEAALQAKIAEFKIKLNKLKSSHAVNSLENPSLLSATRRDIARMQTVLASLKQAHSQANQQANH